MANFLVLLLNALNVGELWMSVGRLLKYCDPLTVMLLLHTFSSLLAGTATAILVLNLAVRLCVSLTWVNIAFIPSVDSICGSDLWIPSVDAETHKVL